MTTPLPVEAEILVLSSAVQKIFTTAFRVDVFMFSQEEGELVDGLGAGVEAIGVWAEAFGAVSDLIGVVSVPMGADFFSGGGVERGGFFVGGVLAVRIGSVVVALNSTGV